MRRRSSAARDCAASTLSASVAGMPSALRRSREFRPHLLALSLASAFAVAPTAFANPAGGVAIQGSATYVNNGNQLTVTTQNGAGTSHSAINWQSFSIPAGSGTNFLQPNAASTVINNVITNTPSAIFGTLSSNGRVVLVNQSGITVGAGAVVDTAGFTASALGMTQDDAKAGRLRFGSSIGGSTGAIQVQGNIIARGGDVVLIAPNIEVAQTAVIEAQNGTAILAAGQKVEVTGRGLEGIVMEVQAPSDKAVNLGTLRGDAVGIFAGQLRHSGLIQANGMTIEGGRVVLKATDLAEVDGKIEATRTIAGVTSGGSVKIDAPIVSMNGFVQASGVNGGSIDVTGGVILQGGRVEASGTNKGGDIKIVARSYVEQTASTKIVAEGGTGVGGNVTVQATDDGASILSSAEVSADGAQGGTVKVSAPTIGMYAANIHADGTAENDGHGGSLEIGGGFHGGDPYLPNSRFVFINNSSTISASSKRNGAGGTVALWSDGDMKFSGLVKALGGAVSGDGGFIEVSGKDNLVFRGTADASAVNGAAGTLLLDPTNITIVEGGASGGSLVAIALNRDDSGLPDSSNFGDTVMMKNGVLVITDPNASFGGQSDAGVIYVFNASNGALIGALHGSHDSDQVGNHIANYNLNTSNLVWYSENWNSTAGALTVFDPTNLVGSMVVSAANSFVGNAGDYLGSGGFVYVDGRTADVILMGSDHYNGGIGAITTLGGSFATIGAGGTSGANAGLLSATNSLVSNSTYENFGSIYGGSSPTKVWGTFNSTDYYYVPDGYFSFGSYDHSIVGDGSQDGYLIVNQQWDNGRGIAVFGSTSAAAPIGEVGVGANVSLRGASANDHVGEHVYYTKTDGATDWLIGSPQFQYTGLSGAGAMTYISSASGLNGVVSDTNSVVGEYSGDQIGGLAPMFGDGQNESFYPSAYILRSPTWHGGYGAVGVINYSQHGVVDPATPGFNITTGATLNDSFGSDVNSFYVNANGDFMQIESQYNNQEGGIFWYSETGVQTGKLTGGTTYGTFQFGNNATPTYGDHVIISTPTWASVDGTDLGAITVVDRHVGQFGIISSSNSIVGTTPGEKLGYDLEAQTSQATSIGSGWWAIKSSGWGVGRGAYSLIYEYNDIPTGHIGVGENNISVVGSQPGDLTDSRFSQADFSGPKFALLSPNWASDKGAITLLDLDFLGNSHTVVDSSNSLVGESGDHLGGVGQTQWSGDYLIVQAPQWGGGRGAVAAITYANGEGGTGMGTRVGAIDSTNALIGTYADGEGGGDRVGSGLIARFNYVGTDYLLVSSPQWGTGDEDARANGAVTIRALNDVTGQVGLSNSMIGANPGENFGPASNQTNNVLLVGNKLIVSSPDWNDVNNSVNGTGAVTWISMASPTGVVNTSTNTITGDSDSDHIGSGGFYGPNVVYGLNVAPFAAGPTDDYNVLISDQWHGNSGAITAITAAPLTGTLSAANSFVGAESDGMSVGAAWNDAIRFDNGAVLLRSDEGGGYGGAYTLFQDASQIIGTMDGTAVTGNSIVGNDQNNLSGSRLIYNNSDDYYGENYRLNNYAVLQQTAWNDGDGSNMGSIRILNTDLRSTVVGDTVAGNALVGQYSNDRLGDSDIYVLRNGRIAVTSLDANNGQGAFTIINPVAPTTNHIDATNSLLSDGGDYRYMNMNFFANGNFVLNSIGYGGGQGALTFFDIEAPTVGLIGSSNSLVGGSANSGAYRYAYGNAIDSSRAMVFIDSSWGEGRGMATVFNQTGGLKPMGDISVGVAGVLTGTSTDDEIGNWGISVYSDSQFALNSPQWNNARGAMTWGNSATGFGDATSVSEVNSLVGHYDGDRVSGSYGEGSQFTTLGANSYAIALTDYHYGRGAYAFYRYGAVGDISTKSIVEGDGNGYISYYSGYDAPINLNNGLFALVFRGNGEGTGQVVLTDGNPDAFGTPFHDIHFNDTPDEDATVTNGNIAAMMAAGTNVLLQASNDIYVNAGITVEAGAGRGALNLQAGRSIEFNANVSTGNGDLNATANASGADTEYRSGGAGGIKIASGVGVNAGSGNVNLTVDAEGQEAGDIVINGALAGGNITLTTPKDVVVQAIGGNAASVAAINLAVNATSMDVAADLAAATVTTIGAVNVNLTGEGSTLTLSGGSGAGASASIVSGGNATFTANTIELNGGSGTNSYALLDPTLPGSTMTISTIEVLLNGGSGDGSYAALVSTGGDLIFVNPLPSIFFNPGTGTRADAVIYAPNGDLLAKQFSLPYIGENSPFSNQIRDYGFAKYRLPYTLDQGDFLSGFDYLFDELEQWRRRNSKAGLVVSCDAATS